MTNDRHGDEVCRRTGIHHDTVSDAKPRRPLVLEGPHLPGLREYRDILEKRNHLVQVLPGDVILHQRPMQTRFLLRR